MEQMEVAESVAVHRDCGDFVMPTLVDHVRLIYAMRPARIAVDQESSASR